LPLLGKIVEVVSGQAFAEFVAHEVFAPLGMKSSAYVTGPMPRERMAVGYFKDGERLVPDPDRVGRRAGSAASPDRRTITDGVQLRPRLDAEHHLSRRRHRPALRIRARVLGIDSTAAGAAFVALMISSDRQR
jgi:CubicO group peptidase (beta-lactamase class C family)